MSNLINSIRSFILTCPFLQDGRVNVDYIGEEMGYSIDPLPCDPIVQRYTHSPAKRNMIRIPESISKTADSFSRLMNGWRNRALMGNFPS